MEHVTTASEFTRNFEHYQRIAQSQPVAVITDGRTTGYFVSAELFEELQRIKANARRSRAVIDMTEEEIKQIAASRMAPEHDHLNARLDESRLANNGHGDADRTAATPGTATNKRFE